MKTIYLSQADREAGTRNLVRHAFFNGLGFTLLGETTVILLAIHFGATNTQLGYIAGVIHITGLSVLIIPYLLAGKSISRAFATAWYLRGLVCLLYGLTLFTEGPLAVWLILGIYTLFGVLRTVGTILFPIIQRSLANPGAIGDIVTRSTIPFQLSSIIGRFGSFLLLKVPLLAGVYGLLALQLMGVFFNALSAWYIGKLPIREQVEKTRRRGLFSVFASAMKHNHRRVVLMLQWGSICLFVLWGFSIPFLRIVAGFSSSMVFAFTLLGSMSAMSAGYFFKPFADRMGSKPLLIMAHGALIVLGLAWTVVPSAGPHWFFLSLGFVTQFFLFLSMLLVARLVLVTLPEKEKVAYSAMYAFFSALTALAMAFLGGFLADLSAEWSIAPHAYSLPFLGLAVAAGFNAWLSGKLFESGSLSFREAAAILGSTRNLRTFLDIYFLEKAENPLQRETILLNLRDSDSGLATEELRRRLRSPWPWEREQVLKSLFTRPRPELFHDILDQARDPNNFNRVDAIFALGAYPGEETENALLNFFHEQDLGVASTAAKSLARIGHRSRLPIVKMSAARAQNPEHRLNFILALSVMDEEGVYLGDAASMAPAERGFRFNQSVYSIIARSLHLKPALSRYYYRENVTPGRGVRELLDESKELDLFLREHEYLSGLFRNGNYAGVHTWLAAHSAGVTGGTWVPHLMRGLLSYDPERMDKTAAMAAVYFLYHINTLGDAGEADDETNVKPA